MAKGEILTEDDIQQIKTIFWLMPNEKAEKIREKSEALLGRQLGLSTVQRILVPERKAHRERKKENVALSPLDEIWSIGSTAKHPIPSNKIPEILLAQQLLKGGLTVRNVLWFERLYDLFIKNHIDDRLKIKYFAWLCTASILYSNYERYCEYANVRCNTRYIDNIDPRKIRENLLFWFGKNLTDEHRRMLEEGLADY